MNPASSSALIAHGGSGEQPQRSLNRQLVLEEDEYTEALSRIIARDFFPSLVQLEANNDYLDALQSNNPTLIEASVRRLSAIQATPTPYTARDAPTPFGGSVMDTPTNEHRRKRRKYNENLSLDEFQAKYTSEDNSSFTEILNDENERRRRTYSWAWEAEKKAQTQHQLQIEAKQTLLIDRSAAPGVRETLRIELPKSAGLITQGEGPEEEDNKNAEDEGGESPDTSEKAVVLLGTGKYGDSEENAVNVLAKSRDTRPTGVDTWNFRVCTRFLPRLWFSLCSRIAII
jgi:protein DGCR14